MSRAKSRAQSSAASASASTAGAAAGAARDGVGEAGVGTVPGGGGGEEPGTEDAEPDIIAAAAAAAAGPSRSANSAKLESGSHSLEPVAWTRVCAFARPSTIQRRT